MENKIIRITIGISLLLCSILSLKAQQKQFYTINGTKFYTIEKTEIDEGVGKLIWLELYRVEEGGPTYLLRHDLHYIEGDHNSETRTFGKMIIKGNQLEFYSLWGWVGDAPVAPYGSRKQVYRVNKQGKLLLEKSQLYVENIRVGYIPQMLKYLKKNGDNTKGIVGQKYLHQAPKNETEKQLFREYIKEMEETYHAKFVFGKTADQLMKQVKTVFAKELTSLHQEWEIHKKLGRYFKI